MLYKNAAQFYDHYISFKAFDLNNEYDAFKVKLTQTINRGNYL